MTIWTIRTTDATGRTTETCFGSDEWRAVSHYIAAVNKADHDPDVAHIHLCRNGDARVFTHWSSFPGSPRIRVQSTVSGPVPGAPQPNPDDDNILWPA